MGLWDKVSGFFNDPLKVAGTASLLDVGGFASDLLMGLGAQKDQRASNDAAKELAWAQMAAQKEFAQHGIKWKVQDAIDAGLSPLAALGGAGAGYSPVTMIQGENRPLQIGQHLSNMGQNLSRSAMASAQLEERALRKAESNALVNKYNAEADAARGQAAESAKRVGEPTNPPFPSHVAVRNRDGSISYVNNPDIASSIMSDPIGTLITTGSNFGNSVVSGYNQYLHGLSQIFGLGNRDIRGYRMKEQSNKYWSRR